MTISITNSYYFCIELEKCDLKYDSLQLDEIEFSSSFIDTPCYIGEQYYEESCSISFASFIKANKITFKFKLSHLYWYIRYLFTRNSYRENYLHHIYAYECKMRERDKEVLNKKIIEKINVRGFLHLVKSLLRNQFASFKEIIITIHKEYFRIDFDIDSYVMSSLHTVHERNFFITTNQIKNNGNKRFSNNYSTINRQ